MIERIEYEKNPTNYTIVPYENIFPSMDKECVNHEKFSVRKSSSCMSNLLNLFEEPILSIENEIYYSTEKDIEKVMKDKGFFNYTISQNIYNK